MPQNQIHKSWTQEETAEMLQMPLHDYANIEQQAKEITYLKQLKE